MSRIVEFLVRIRKRPGLSCHRCGSLLMGKATARYCANCLWDELEDPTQVQNFPYLTFQKKELKNAA